MKNLIILITWPIIFAIVYYFISFEIAIIVSLLYVHSISILLFHITQLQAKKIEQLAKYITENNTGVTSHPIDLSDIQMAEDVLKHFK